ncbi:helix-turn-helix transcriptional regulator [Flavobacterium oreochromis]|uniref:helix-turn-helix domain-containing protein n=1 Tax=Flavobacterium oreochromis TaxID=2906078 RepID=UPI00385DBCFB
MNFGEHIKQLREQNQLLQRQVASVLEIDTAMLSKIERGERRAKREHIPLLATLLHSNEKELYTIWLADQVYEIIKEESNPTEILQVVERELKLKLKHYE